MPRTASATNSNDGAISQENSESGEFERQEDAFRGWVKREGSTPYVPEAGRYHLCVSRVSVGASHSHFAQIEKARKAISMTVVDPLRDERG